MPTSLWSNLKKRWWLILLGFIIVGGGAWFWHARSAAKTPVYETQTVQRGNVLQTVEVTGQVSPANRIDLSFKASGKLSNVAVVVGQKIKQGDTLALLDPADAQYAVDLARANVATASSNLQARLAGATSQDISISQANVTQAQAAYDKAVSDLATTRQNVEDQYQVASLAVTTAQANANNGDASNDQTVNNANVALANTLQTAFGSLQTALTDGDAIIGVDNTGANLSYQNVLGVNATQALQDARMEYVTCKQSRDAIATAIQNVETSSTDGTTSAASSLTLDGLHCVQTYLDDVQRTLAGTLTNFNFTEAALSAKQAAIEADRSAISGQYASVSTAAQNILSSERARDTSHAQLQNALQTAQANLTIADHNRTTLVQTAQDAVSIQHAALLAAQASLASKQAPPRQVDVSALRAQLQNAQTALEQAVNHLNDTRITAPVDGVVTNIAPAPGEQILAGQTVVTLIGNEMLDVQALVPEADIAKISVGQKASMTLDAFGDSVPFQGMVISEQPDQTKVQDAIYYQVNLSLDANGHDIKPGMTANVTIGTGERDNVIFIPLRAVHTQANSTSTTVLILTNTQAQSENIALGLHGDNGQVEVTDGLQEGQTLIVSQQ